VIWDDHGGWYDHVVPPQLDNNGLGFRVPLIAAGAYVKRGYVSHVRHEYGSLLKFVEYNWRLPTLGTTDRRSDELLDLFDFSAANGARRPVLVPVSHPGATLSFFESLHFDTKPLDYTPEEE
jgi:phospholipase C